MIKIKALHENFKVPKYATLGAACRDIYVPEDVKILPYDLKVIPLGFAIEVPVGYKFELIPRSGLSIKYPNYVANSPGCVDSDYRDEVKLIFWNNTSDLIKFKEGDRICQCDIIQVNPFDFELVDELDMSNDRGGGFGSTGK